MMRDLHHDVRYAFRTLRRSPLFTGLTVATLGLGIGAMTALFAVVNAVVFAPVVADQDRVVRIWKRDAPRGFPRVSISYEEFKIYREQARSIEALAAIMYADTQPAVVTIDEQPLAVKLAAVSANFFEVLQRGRPSVGRWLEAPDDFARDELAAVVSHRFWQRAAARDVGFVGRRVPLAGGVRTLRVVGIAPASFEYPLDVDVWVAIPAFFDGRAGRFDAARPRLVHFELLGRLAPGVSPQIAAAELEVLSSRLEASFPDETRDLPVIVTPLIDAMLGNGRRALVFLLAAAALVFAIAGVDVASLLMIRAAERRRETAVRVALGASQSRLARQTTAEAVILSFSSAAIGLALARLMLGGLQQFAPGDMPRIERASLDATVVAFGAAAAVLCVIALGLVPLWRRDRALSSAMQRARGTAVLRVFTVAEIAAAVVVAIAAGLLVRSFANLQAIDRGFRPASLAVVSMLLPEGAYPDARWRYAAFEQLVAAVRAIPGVVNAAPVHLKPGTGTVGLSASMRFEGQTPEEAASNIWSSWEPTMPSFFDTMGIAIVRGRGFSDADTGSSAPVAVVSESVARQYWPGQDPIGKRLQFVPSMPQTIVVGVAADVRYRELTRDWMTVYFPGSQFFFFGPSALVVRTSTDARTIVPVVRDAIRAQAPRAAIQSVDTMDSLVDRELSRPRAALVVTALFAFIAIALAGIGVYGVLSYEIRQRQQELAIRAAIGASPGQLLRAETRRTLGLTIAGATIGVTIATMLVRWTHTMLYAVEPLDPVAFAGGVAILLSIVLVASYFPVRRAAAADPISTLRAE